MVHWIYILRCSGDHYLNDKIYVGETARLYRRLREHILKKVGSCTTNEYYPNRLLGLYRVKNNYFLSGCTVTIQRCYYDELSDDKNHTRQLENTITEMYMQAMGPKWENVYGGKYHQGYRPCDNPGEEAEFNRPFCYCKIPADINVKDGGEQYWRCSRKNIWDGLHEYIIDELGLERQRFIEPCKFYKEYNEGEKFKCYNFIYDRIKEATLSGKCLIESDCDDDI